MTALRDEIAELFKSLRFNEYSHIGLGDIRLSMGMQEQLISAILTLPKMKEMMACQKHIKALQSYFPEWAISSNTSEPFQTWKEKAEALDNLEYGFPQEVEQALKKVREKRP